MCASCAYNALMDSMKHRALYECCDCGAIKGCSCCKCKQSSCCCNRKRSKYYIGQILRINDRAESIKTTDLYQHIGCAVIVKNIQEREDEGELLTVTAIPCGAEIIADKFFFDII